MNPRRRQLAGFTLIEVLITVAVVSIGLLAVAGLQAIAKKANYDALQRTAAAALGQGIIERIRANPTQGTAYAQYGSEISELYPVSPTVCNPAPNAQLPSPAAAFCTPAQVAQANLYAWSQELLGAAEQVIASGATPADTNLGGLQHAAGCISVNACGALKIYTVAIVWRGLSPVAPPGSDLTDPSSNSCGNDALQNQFYQPPTGYSSMTMRRVLVFQAAILDPSVGTVPSC